MQKPVGKTDAVRNEELTLEQVRFAQQERIRRRESPVLVKREQYLGQPAHVFLVDPRLGFNNRTHRFWINKLPAGGEETQVWKTLGQRHSVESVIYWLSGHGYSIVDGIRYDWKEGDLICVPMFAWHRHVNNSDEIAHYVASSTDPLCMGIGQAVYEDERYPQHWVCARQGGGAVKSPLPGGAEGPGISQEPAAASEAQRLYGEQISFAYREELNRRKGKVLLKSEDIKLEPTIMGRMAYLIDPRVGFHVKALATVLGEVPPGKHSGSHRHLYDEIDFVLQGRGKVIIDDKTYEVELGDTLAIPVFAWHQYFSTGGEPLRVLCHSTRPAMENLGLVLTQHGENANYT